MLIIFISVEVKMEATHSLGTSLRTHISSDFSPFKLCRLLFSRKMQLYPSGHFCLLIRKLNSFPSKESKRKKKSISPHLLLIIMSLWGHWPSGKSIALVLGSAYDLAAANWFTHLPGPPGLCGRVRRRNACLVCTPGLSWQSSKKKCIQKHFENEGAKYVRNFIMEYNNVSFIFHSIFMGF